MNTTAPTKSLPISLRASRLALALLLASPGSILANPTGGSVVGGAASISQAGNTVTINQTTNNAVINWQGFSIGGGELTRFVQPSAASAVLNRVTGGDPSAIYGTLSANGRVFLVNPNGVTVGPTGVINAQSFIASTLDVPLSAFLTGADLTFSGNSAAKVSNYGAINALGGDVVLIARSVENTGRISAPNGTAALAAGTEVLLASDHGMTSVFVKSGAGDGGVGVDQKGAIDAAVAELKAAGGNMYAVAINNEGLIRATAVEERGGQVYLTADAGLVQNGGQIAAKSGDKGGLVEVTGGQVALKSGSGIDVSGEAGGGAAYIGGGFHGQDAGILNSGATTIESGASVTADALTSGDGGQVAVWSDGATSFKGAISARGGAAGGDAGFVEVSGHTLGFHGLVDLRSPFGKDGTLLLDPYDLSITANPTSGMDTTTDPQNPVSTADDAELNVGDLTGQLALSDVNVQTGGGFGVGTGFGDINVQTDIAYNSAHNLSLTAQGSVHLNAAIENTGTGGVTLTSGGLGAIFMNVSGTPAVDTTGGGAQTYNGAVNLLADTSLTSGGAITFAAPISGASALTTNSVGATNFNGPANAASLDATAAGGININGGGVLTTAGQAYHSAVAVGPFTTLVGGGDITLDNGINAGANDLVIDANTGNVALTGAVAANNLALHGNNVTWNGGITAAAEADIAADNDAVMNNSLTVTAGNATITDGHAFLNAGANAITTGGGGHFEIYSQSPAADNLGGLTPTVLAGVMGAAPACSAGNCLYYPAAGSAASPVTPRQKNDLQNPFNTGAFSMPDAVSRPEAPAYTIQQLATMISDSVDGSAKRLKEIGFNTNTDLLPLLAPLKGDSLPAGLSDPDRSSKVLAALNNLADVLGSAYSHDEVVKARQRLVDALGGGAVAGNSPSGPRNCASGFAGPDCSVRLASNGAAPQATPAWSDDPLASATQKLLDAEAAAKTAQDDAAAKHKVLPDLQAANDSAAAAAKTAKGPLDTANDAVKKIQGTLPRSLASLEIYQLQMTLASGNPESDPATNAAISALIAAKTTAAAAQKAYDKADAAAQAASKKLTDAQAAADKAQTAADLALKAQDPLATALQTALKTDQDMTAPTGDDDKKAQAKLQDNATKALAGLIGGNGAADRVAANTSKTTDQNTATVQQVSYTAPVVECVGLCAKVPSGTKPQAGTQALAALGLDQFNTDLKTAQDAKAAAEEAAAAKKAAQDAVDQADAAYAAAESDTGKAAAAYNRAKSKADRSGATAADRKAAQDAKRRWDSAVSLVMITKKHRSEAGAAADAALLRAEHAAKAQADAEAALAADLASVKTNAQQTGDQATKNPGSADDKKIAAQSLKDQSTAQAEYDAYLKGTAAATASQELTPEGRQLSEALKTVAQAVGAAFAGKKPTADEQKKYDDAKKLLSTLSDDDKKALSDAADSGNEGTLDAAINKILNVQTPSGSGSSSAAVAAKTTPLAVPKGAVAGKGSVVPAGGLVVLSPEPPLPSEFQAAGGGGGVKRLRQTRVATTGVERERAELRATATGSSRVSAIGTGRIGGTAPGGGRLGTTSQGTGGRLGTTGSSRESVTVYKEDPATRSGTPADGGSKQTSTSSSGSTPTATKAAPSAPSAVGADTVPVMTLGKKAAGAAAAKSLQNEVSNDTPPDIPTAPPSDLQSVVNSLPKGSTLLTNTVSASNNPNTASTVVSAGTPQGASGSSSASAPADAGSALAPQPAGQVVVPGAMATLPARPAMPDAGTPSVEAPFPSLGDAARWIGD